LQRAAPAIRGTGSVTLVWLAGWCSGSEVVAGHPGVVRTAAGSAALRGEGCPGHGRALGPTPREAGACMAIRWVVTTRAPWAEDLFGGGGGGAPVVKDGQPSAGG